MSKSNKVWLGIFSFAPLIVSICLLSYLLSFFITNRFEELDQAGGTPGPWLLAHLAGFIVFAIGLGLLMLSALIYFMIHVINSKQIKNEERIIWVLVFIFAGTIGFPIYWAIRIWPGSKTIETPPLSNFVKVD